mmetsp:Transcript_8956/g.15394  ORF Transcript_8956/g.15394 Transcript_8956/m.15394 type:complete len:146 (-) Transcript_8956:182-619(-)
MFFSVRLLQYIPDWSKFLVYFRNMTNRSLCDSDLSFLPLQSLLFSASFSIMTNTVAVFQPLLFSAPFSITTNIFAVFPFIHTQLPEVSCLVSSVSTTVLFSFLLGSVVLARISRGHTPHGYVFLSVATGTVSFKGKEQKSKKNKV